MAWFSVSRPPAEPAPPSGHRSQALNGLLGALPPNSRHAVLDLGPPLAANIKFLSALSCRVRIADLLRSLSAESIENRQPDAIGALFERLLPLAPDERFDAMLAWNVFDYLRPDQVSSLMARLTPACNPEAPVLVLVSTRPKIPALPPRYRILDRENLACDGPREPVRACPRYTQPDLEHMMPGLVVRRSFLLRNGIQEYLFARGTGEGIVRPQQASAAWGASSRRFWFQRGRG